MGDGKSSSSKQWILGENETITSFLDWRLNMEHHLSLENEFYPFFNLEWSIKSVRNRGLRDDTAEISENDRKTAFQKNTILERMLLMVAQYSPPALQTDIVGKSTSLAWVWDILREHYSFPRSEINFLQLYSIQRHEDEHYGAFYQRILTHVENNLLTDKSSTTNSKDEVMSPTIERLAVYIWLILIDPGLPAYVSKIFAHQLQSKTLKDIQPQLADSMTSLIEKMSSEECARSDNLNNRYFQVLRKKERLTGNQEESSKSYEVCKIVGHHYNSNDMHTFSVTSTDGGLHIATPNSEKMNASGFEYNDNENERNIGQEVQQQKSSPSFYAFYKHTPCCIFVDTNSSCCMVSKSFLVLAGIDVNPNPSSCNRIDKIQEFQGEVNFIVNFGDYNLPISALVVETYNWDISLDLAFCDQNDIEVNFESEELRFRVISIPFQGKPMAKEKEVFRVESFILRNDIKRVVLPGDFIEIGCDALSKYEGEISIEGRRESPLDESWPNPRTSRIIQGTIRIPNLSPYPIQLKEKHDFAQIRQVLIPEALPQNDVKGGHVSQTENFDRKHERYNSSSQAIIIDPDNLLSDEKKLEFININKRYSTVFDGTFVAYNNHSRTIQTSIDLGTVIPPLGKCKIPSYKLSDLHLLQEEADRLEKLGILANPEDIGIHVRYVSPSFLVKKSYGRHSLVTNFDDLRQYTQNHHSSFSSRGDALKKLSSWRFIIKVDLTPLLLQIPVAKSSTPYLGISTPFKGCRVYVRSVVHMPGSTESLQELVSRVFCDMLREGFVISIGNDLYVCGYKVSELSQNWCKVLKRMKENRLNLSDSRTIICPKETTVLGWVWNAGTLNLNPLNLTPLLSVEPPKTLPSMRSFISTFKSISKCIRMCVSLISPLEDAIKELQDSLYIEWSPELLTSFRQAQDALKCPLTLTIPRRTDKLLMTVDATPRNRGLGITLSLIRSSQLLVAEYYSFKLRSYQLNWLPCEYEALAIATGIEHFSSYIKESVHSLLVKTENKSCVQAFRNLREGMFSLSSRVSIFLSTICSYRVEIINSEGRSSKKSNFNWYLPKECTGKSCQICKFAAEGACSLDSSLTVSTIHSGLHNMPFLNSMAWRFTQHECAQLRRTYVHLIQGTRPSKNARNLKELRHYIQVASVNGEGLLVVTHQDCISRKRDLIIVPTFILPGLITALHLRLNHPSNHDLTELFCKFFYALNSVEVIKQVFQRCDVCNKKAEMENDALSNFSHPFLSETANCLSDNIDQSLPSTGDRKKIDVSESNHEERNLLQNSEGSSTQHTFATNSSPSVSRKNNLMIQEIKNPTEPKTLGLTSTTEQGKFQISMIGNESYTSSTDTDQESMLPEKQPDDECDSNSSQQVAEIYRDNHTLITSDVKDQQMERWNHDNDIKGEREENEINFVHEANAIDVSSTENIKEFLPNDIIIEHLTHNVSSYKRDTENYVTSVTDEILSKDPDTFIDDICKAKYETVDPLGNISSINEVKTHDIKRNNDDSISQPQREVMVDHNCHSIKSDEHDDETMLDDRSQSSFTDESCITNGSTVDAIQTNSKRKCFIDYPLLSDVSEKKNSLRRDDCDLTKKSKNRIQEDDSPCRKDETESPLSTKIEDLMQDSSSVKGVLVSENHAGNNDAPRYTSECTDYDTSMEDLPQIETLEKKFTCRSPFSSAISSEPIEYMPKKIKGGSTSDMNGQLSDKLTWSSDIKTSISKKPAIQIDLNLHSTSPEFDGNINTTSSETLTLTNETLTRLASPFTSDIDKTFCLSQTMASNNHVAFTDTKDFVSDSGTQISTDNASISDDKVMTTNTSSPDVGARELSGNVIPESTQTKTLNCEMEPDSPKNSPQLQSFNDEQVDTMEKKSDIEKLLNTKKKTLDRTLNKDGFNASRHFFTNFQPSSRESFYRRRSTYWIHI